jgi:uncharacterized protein (DUF302 family)
MATNVLLLVVGVILGMLIMGLAVWFMMPKLMLIKRKSNLQYGKALESLNNNLQNKQDWMLVKVNDYQERTASFGAMEKVCSVNICNPRYASMILKDDANRGVTAFMPPAIGIYEDKKGQVFVSQLNVGLLGMMFGGTIAKVMSMAGKDIKELVGGITNQ